MEAMAAESLVACAWELDGFLTKIRWPVRSPHGQFSDIDVVGVNAEGSVRFAECKVPWGPRAIRVVDRSFAKNFGHEEPCNWLDRADNIRRIWADSPPWLPNKRDVKSVEFWICANVWFSDEAAREAAKRSVYTSVRKKCPRELKDLVTIEIRSTRDVLFQVVTGVRKSIHQDRHGRRFGHPILDAVRELLRYTHPAPSGGGRVAKRIALETRNDLLSALGFVDTE